ncbi:MAG: HK97 gp10 family phage protein [Thiomonas arsenitoxydans]|nr:HK97 gp10 family phage protein [Thiomonas arsenitoxydans]
MELRNLKETQKAMDQTVRDLHGTPMMQAIRDATLLITRSARRAAPVDTGRLRASIAPEVVQGAHEVQGVVGSNVVYAPFVETGSRPHWPPPGVLERWSRRHGIPEFLVMRAIALRGTKAQPYLEPAVEENLARIMRLLERAVQKATEGQ